MQSPASWRTFAVGVTQDPDAISRKRPQKYIEREDEQFVKTAVKKRVLPAEEAEHLEYTKEK
ncbi:hypothetical protein N7467_007000 [Penicillium canescens]|nr:hypothetical protein N7467_007000 [Penicillium canescens]